MVVWRLSLCQALFCTNSSYSKLQYFASNLINRHSLMGSIVSCSKRGLTLNAGNKMNSDGETASKEYFEEIVCSASDIPNESAKAFNVNGKSILLAKSEGEIYAVGSKCTHFGLPLENGSVCKGRIRCPFHGACFKLETGDIEDFPGLDSLPKFKAEVVDGQVRVSGKTSLLDVKKRKKDFVKRDATNEKTFVVVGGGAAGAKCVESLRQEGFTGRVLLLTSEAALPYDRTKLSKAMHLTHEALALRDEEFYKGIDVEVKLSSEVTNVNPENRRLKISSGEEIAFDKLFLATGGSPRKLGVPGADLDGVFMLRSPTDANAIAGAAKGKRVVVIGTSFIGMEVAAYLSSDDRCASVTVVGSSAVPFERCFGVVVGERIQRMFEEKGVTVINGAKVSKLEGNDAVEKVIINDSKELPAEVVVAGIGVVPSTAYLNEAAIKKDSQGHVCVNEELETSAKGIFCGGDIAAFPLFLNPGTLTSIGHWQMAHHHGHLAALNMVGKKQSIRSVPFFWTSLFGKSFRYTGYGDFEDVIISGDMEALSFIAYYTMGSRVVSLLSIGKAPAAAKYADALLHGQILTREQVEADGDKVLKM